MPREEYNRNLIQHYFNNDSPKNPRSDGGFITIAVQVNPIDLSEPGSKGRITIWHIKNTIPEEGDGSDPALPDVGSTPVFAGELKMEMANDSVYTDRPKTPGKTPGKKPPKAMIRVPYIILEPPYQRSLRMSPIFWKFVCETAQVNFHSRLNAWNNAKAKQQELSTEARKLLTEWATLEPPMGLVAAGLPDPNMRDYWDKVGFNFFATQHEQAWLFDAQSRADTMAVLTGTATNEVKARIAPWLQVTTSVTEIQGAVDYLAELAADGMKRGGWSETNEPV